MALNPTTMATMTLLTAAEAGASDIETKLLKIT